MDQFYDYGTKKTSEIDEIRQMKSRSFNNYQGQSLDGLKIAADRLGNLLKNRQFSLPENVVSYCTMQCILVKCVKTINPYNLWVLFILAKQMKTPN